jgi:formylglycine-generating enzyme required for sulfatase activity
MSKRGVFISYRRDTGSAVARLLQEYLEGQGFEVFLDVDGLGTGHFDGRLLREIESRRNFLLVCSGRSLDRCVNEGDWLAREIAHALRTRRHILPVTLADFSWPSGPNASPIVAALQRHNAFEYSHDHWGMTKPRLAAMLGDPEDAAPASALTDSVVRRTFRRIVWSALLGVGVTSVALIPLAFDGPRPSDGPPSSTRSNAELDVRGRADLEGASPSDFLPAAGLIPTKDDGDAAGGPWGALSLSTQFDIIQHQPAPSVVTDESGRSRMTRTGLPWKVRDRRTGIVLLLCPPGEFTMGSPKSERHHQANEVQQLVVISKPFYLSESEVTQEQWGALMGRNPSKFLGAGNPVEQASWDDCQRFCHDSGLRLPSEAEWEYACRAGTSWEYSGDLDVMGWHGRNSGNSPHPVGQKRANPWGLRDMHGNVWEWCEDSYEPTAAGTQPPAMGGHVRVLRGGSWVDLESNCRTAVRYYDAPSAVSSSNGFRVARTAD